MPESAWLGCAACPRQCTGIHEPECRHPRPASSAATSGTAVERRTRASARWH